MDFMCVYLLLVNIWVGMLCTYIYSAIKSTAWTSGTTAQLAKQPTYSPFTRHQDGSDPTNGKLSSSFIHITAIVLLALIVN